MAPQRLLVAGAALGLLVTACGAASIEDTASCGELRSAWEDAGGPVANYSIQVRTVERVTELGAGDLPRDEALTCHVLFDDALAAAGCSAPDTPPAFRSCG